MRVRPAYGAACRLIVLGGKQISKRQAVIAVMSAANRDPERFPNPDDFDIERKDNRHLAFGYAAHFCFGAPLARAEGQIVFETLLRRMPKLRLEPQKFVWRTNLGLRGLTSLKVKFGDEGSKSQPVSVHEPLRDQATNQQIQWNNTRAEYPSDKCVHQLVEERIIASQSIAVIRGAPRLTYRERRAGEPIGAFAVAERALRAGWVCLPRSPELPSALLGVMKAGGACHLWIRLWIAWHACWTTRRLRY
jgi:hypothetical protein